MIFVVAIWKIFGVFKPYLLKLIANFTNSESDIIQNIISAFLGLLDVVVSIIITSFIESIFPAQQDLPKIFVTSSNQNITNISGMKLRHSYNPHLCVKIGNEQRQFRVVYAEIKNTGKGIISECSINKQALGFILEPGQSRNFYLILYESENCAQTSKKYKLPYCIIDEQGNIYTGKYSMQVDQSKSSATFRPYKKMKRSLLRNALSNL